MAENLGERDARGQERDTNRTPVPNSRIPVLPPTGNERDKCDERHQDQENLMKAVLPETKGDADRDQAENDRCHQAMDQTQNGKKNAKAIAPIGRLMSRFRLRQVRILSQELDGVSFETSPGSK